MASVFLEVDFARLAWRTASHLVHTPDRDTGIDPSRWPELFAEAFEAGPAAHGTIDNRHGYAAARTGDHEIILLTPASIIPTEWMAQLLGSLAELGGDLHTLRLARTRVQLEGAPDSTPPRHIGRIS